MFLLVNLKCQMEYRASFIMSILTKVLQGIIQFISAYFLILKFWDNNLFSFSEIIICFSVVSIGLGVGEMFFRSFDTFSMIVREGTYDRILLRPVDEILQLIEYKMDFNKIGYIIPTLIILAYSLPKSSILWTYDKILLFILMILGSCLIYGGIFIFGAALCFYTTEGLELINILTNGTQNFGIYPFRAMGKTALRFLTLFVPLALVQEYPLAYLTGATNSPLVFILPLGSIVFLFIMVKFFKFSSRRYISIGG